MLFRNYIPNVNKQIGNTFFHHANYKGTSNIKQKTMKQYNKNKNSITKWATTYEEKNESLGNCGEQTKKNLTIGKIVGSQILKDAAGYRILRGISQCYAKKNGRLNIATHVM